jgi:Ferric reductase like transmembrane component
MTSTMMDSTGAIAGTGTDDEFFNDYFKNVDADQNTQHLNFFDENEHDNEEHSDTEESTTDDSNDEEKLQDLVIFQKARQYLRPSFFFRWVISLYAQRKMVVFFLIHLMSTLVIWAHFAMIKFQQQKENVPETANQYMLKRIIPTIEFGSMHAILFQMSLIPLTMCRYSIASLSDSVLQTIVPLNRTLRMHIHLGYVMISIVFFATVVFFGFFGFLCVHEGEQPFCDKFTVEIMITGYCILGSLLLVGVTSFLRHRIPYEVFYGTPSQLSFCLYHLQQRVWNKEVVFVPSEI